MKLTLEQVKQNYLDKMSARFHDTYENGDGSWDEFCQKEYDEEVEKLKKELSNVKSIKEMVPFFDDNAINSWDIHGILKFTLECFVEEK